VFPSSSLLDHKWRRRCWPHKPRPPAINRRKRTRLIYAPSRTKAMPLCPLNKTHQPSQALHLAVLKRHVTGSRRTTHDWPRLVLPHFTPNFTPWSNIASPSGTVRQITSISSPVLGWPSCASGRGPLTKERSGLSSVNIVGDIIAVKLTRCWPGSGCGTSTGEQPEIERGLRWTIPKEAAR
jgi:hypothetical protein